MNHISFYMFLLVALSMNVNAQSFEMHLSEVGNGTIPLCGGVLSDNQYYMVRSIRNEDLADREVTIEVVVFDSCGVIESHLFPVENTFSILSGTNMNQGNGIIKLELRVNPVLPHGGHAELAVMTIFTDSWTAKFQYFQGRNVTYNYALHQEGDGYLSYGIVSYTDKRPMYYLNELNENLKVEKSISFLPTYNGGGEAQRVPSGVMCATNESIHLFNDNFEEVWSRSLPFRTWVRHSIKVADGVVFILGAWSDGNPVAILVDYEGNLKWVSKALRTSGSGSKIIPIKEGNFISVFTTSNDNISGNGYVNLKVIDVSSGAFIRQEKYQTQVSSFDMKSVTKTSQGYLAFGAQFTSNSVAVHFDPNDLPCYKVEVDTSTIGDQYTLSSFNFQGTVQESFDFGEIEINSEESNRAVSISCENIDPVFDLLPDDTLICQGGAYFANIFENVYDVVWNDGDTSKTKTLGSGMHFYTYQICDEKHFEEINILDEDCSCQVYIPTAFSPNNDGVNDRFEIYPDCKEFKLLDFQIFDRWGKVVFESVDDEFSWNGNYKDKPHSEGSYSYQLKYVAFGISEPVLRSGDIMLVR